MKYDIQKIAENLSSNEIDIIINKLLIIKDTKISEEKFINDLFKSIEEKGIDPNKIAQYFNKKEIEFKKQKKIKYRLNLDGKEYSYSGLGKKPKWFINYIENGGDIKDIEVS